MNHGNFAALTKETSKAEITALPLGFVINLRRSLGRNKFVDV